MPVAVGVEIMNIETGKPEEKVIPGTATFTLEQKLEDGGYLYQQTQVLGGVIRTKTCVNINKFGKVTPQNC